MVAWALFTTVMRGPTNALLHVIDDGMLAEATIVSQYSVCQSNKLTVDFVILANDIILHAKLD